MDFYIITLPPTADSKIRYWNGTLYGKWVEERSEASKFTLEELFFSGLAKQVEDTKVPVIEIY